MAELDNSLHHEKTKTFSLKSLILPVAIGCVAVGCLFYQGHNNFVKYEQAMQLKAEELYQAEERYCTRLVDLETQVIKLQDSNNLNKQKLSEIEKDILNQALDSRNMLGIAESLRPLDYTVIKEVEKRVRLEEQQKFLGIIEKFQEFTAQHDRVVQAYEAIIKAYEPYIPKPSPPPAPAATPAAAPATAPAQAPAPAKEPEKPKLVQEKPKPAQEKPGSIEAQLLNPVKENPGPVEDELLKLGKPEK